VLQITRLQIYNLYTAKVFLIDRGTENSSERLQKNKKKRSEKKLKKRLQCKNVTKVKKN